MQILSGDELEQAQYVNALAHDALINQLFSVLHRRPVPLTQIEAETLQKAAVLAKEQVQGALWGMLSYTASGNAEAVAAARGRADAFERAEMRLFQEAGRDRNGSWEMSVDDAAATAELFRPLGERYAAHLQRYL